MQQVNGGKNWSKFPVGFILFSLLLLLEGEERLKTITTFNPYLIIYIHIYSRMVKKLGQAGNSSCTKVLNNLLVSKLQVIKVVRLYRIKQARPNP